MLLIALAVSTPTTAAGCMWDSTEFVLKASMLAAEKQLLLDWIDGYLQAMTCFPRLHIITSDAQIDRARIVFARVPNVTVRANNYPVTSASQALHAEGRSSLDPVAFVFMQWPMLWLDNFTSAPHVLTWDVDSLPVLPLRCHHLFDEEERPLWFFTRRPRVHGRKHDGLPSWIGKSNDVYKKAEARGETLTNPSSILSDDVGETDFAAYYPMVVPRAILPLVRGLITRAYSAPGEEFFDAAWVRAGRLSYQDVLGKGLALMRPGLARTIDCPLGFAQARKAGTSCIEHVFNAEHTRHPIGGFHVDEATGFKLPASRQPSLSHSQAHVYGRKLLNQSASFQAGQGLIPAELFAYPRSRALNELKRVGADFLREEPGRICGVGNAAKRRADRSGSTTDGVQPNLQNRRRHRNVVDGSQGTADSLDTGGDEADPSAVRTVRELANATWLKNTKCSSPGGRRWRYADGFNLWHASIVDVHRAMLEDPQLARLPTVASGDVYIFGAAQGSSVPTFHRDFPTRKLYGFDSFEGLPAYEDDAQSKIGTWFAGQFKSKKSPEQLVKLGGGPATARMFKGWFNETMTPSLARDEGMRTAFFVDVDCDLHVSTYHALDWLFSNSMIGVGTLFGLDDFWVVPCNKRYLSRGEGARPNGVNIDPLSVAEGLGLAEMTQKYGVHLACVAGPCRPPPAKTATCDLHNNWAPIWMVTAFSSDGTHSVEFPFTSAEREAWMDSRRPCRYVG